MATWGENLMRYGQKSRLSVVETLLYKSRGTKYLPGHRAMRVCLREGSINARVMSKKVKAQEAWQRIPKHSCVQAAFNCVS